MQAATPAVSGATELRFLEVDVVNDVRDCS